MNLLLSPEHGFGHIPHQVTLDRTWRFLSFKYHDELLLVRIAGCPQALYEAIRVLKPGGKVVIVGLLPGAYAKHLQELGMKAVTDQPTDWRCCAVIYASVGQWLPAIIGMEGSGRQTDEVNFSRPSRRLR